MSKDETLKIVGSGNEFPLTRTIVDTVLARPDHTPEEVVDLFARDFSTEFASNAGGWEGYTLRQHTEMVLTQFNKYFADKLPKGISRNFFEVVLALHDIGKPQAVIEGHGERQHEYTTAIVRSTLSRLQFSEAEINIATSLIGADPIGDYLQFNLKSEAVEKIKAMSLASGMSLPDFWALLKIYYQVDAGSYTTDAEGRDSLDHVFSFDSKNGCMDFAPLERARIAELDRLLND